MTPHPVGMSAIATNELELLSAYLMRAPADVPITKPSLRAAQLGHLWNSLQSLGALDGSTLRRIVDAVLSERHSRPATRVDLVWTGTEAKTAYARPTATVVREMFETACEHVLIAGYSFDHGAAILQPLHYAMATRRVAVDLYLHIERANSQRDVAAHVERAVATFFAMNWPFGTPHPALYIAPRTIDPQLCESLHAKCVIIDSRVALVGSANFTDRGQSRNIEAGARIDDAGFAQALVGQFRAATNAGIFRVVNGGSGLE